MRRASTQDYLMPGRKIMSAATFLVFGDLHGRVLPAFRLALVWQREHGQRVDGLLQVGDLGYFPDPARMDRATLKQARDDPLELGVLDVVQPSKLADQIFSDPEIPQALWFIAGNHEDHDTLRSLDRAAGRDATDFPVDHYLQVRCIRDGAVTTLPGGLRVGGLWGIDGERTRARKNSPGSARINNRSVTNLSAASFDVLLSHDSPLDAMIPGSGSEGITEILHQVRPAFSFFGHYHGNPLYTDQTFAPTRVHFLHGMELRVHGGRAEPGSVGVLRWQDGQGTFDYLEDSWLRTFTRHNWLHR